MKRRDMNQALVASSAAMVSLGLGLGASAPVLAQGGAFAEGID